MRWIHTGPGPTRPQPSRALAQSTKSPTHSPFHPSRESVFGQQGFAERFAVSGQKKQSVRHSCTVSGRPGLYRFRLRGRCGRVPGSRRALRPGPVLAATPAWLAAPVAPVPTPFWPTRNHPVWALSGGLMFLVRTYSTRVNPGCPPTSTSLTQETDDVT
jgi:hypothetical protein